MTGITHSPDSERSADREEAGNTDGTADHDDADGDQSAFPAPAPVTVLSGALGAGKTTTLNRLLGAADDEEFAVLVNDVGEVNVDAELVGRRVENEMEVLELSNGCICCGISGEFESAIVELALNESFDRLLVEPSGISEPAPVVRPFVRGHASGFYDVESVATVVDARVVADAFGGGRSGNERDDRHDPPDPAATDRTIESADDPRPLTDLVVEGVEFCDTAVVNKTDLVDDAELEAVLETVAALRPEARVLTASFGRVDPDDLLGTDRFDLDAVSSGAGWKRALERHAAHADEAGEMGEATAAEDGADQDHQPDYDHQTNHDHQTDHDHAHPPAEYGVESTVYERRRPFHPERLATLFADPPAELLRAKGWVHVAGRPDHALTLSLAGGEVHADVAGRWIASLDADRQDRYRRARDPDWDEDYGDRKTQLVVIGRDLEGIEPAAGVDGAPDDRGVVSLLDACLCTDAELAADGITPDPEPDDNPFPAREGRRVRL